MKKILFAALLFSTITASAQKWQDPLLYGKKESRLGVGKVFMYPTGCGGPATLVPVDSAVNQAAFYFDTCAHKLWNYDSKLKAWDTIHLGVAGSGSSLSFTLPLLNTAGTVAITGLSGYGSSGQLIRSTGTGWEYFTSTYLTSIPTLQQTTDAGKVTTNSIFVDSLNIFDDGFGSGANSIYNWFGAFHFDAFAYPEFGFNPGSLSAARLYTVPNKSGTIALTDDILTSLIYDSIRYTPEITNLKSDTCTFVKFSTLSNVAGNLGWKKNSLWVTNSTETVVAGGLQILNTYSGSLNGTNSIIDTAWESQLNHKTIYVDFKLDSAGVTNPNIGLYFWGATNFFSTFRLGLVNPTTSAVLIITLTGSHSVGTLANAISLGDDVRIYFTENFDFYTMRIVNYTKKKDETFTYNENGGTGTSSVTNCYPGLYVQNLKVTIQNNTPRYYAHNWRPDLMIVGSSISQNQKFTHGYDSSFGGQLQKASNMRIEMAAKSANSLEDIMESYKEIIAMQPGMLQIEGPYNNVQTLGQSVSTWLPNHRAVVDTALNHGIRVIVANSIPANNSAPLTIKNVFDTTFKNDPRVYYLDIYDKTPAYNTGFSNNCNTAYYSDAGIHPNMAEGWEMASWEAKQLERFRHFNMNGGNDANQRSFRNHLIWAYDSTGVNGGEWRSYRVKYGLIFNSDSTVSIDTTGLSGGGSGSGTVTSFTFTDGNGFDGTVTNSTTTPTLGLAITATTKAVLFANAGAVAGSDIMTQETNFIKIAANGSTPPLIIEGHEDLADDALTIWAHAGHVDTIAMVRQDSTIWLAVKPLGAPIVTPPSGFISLYAMGDSIMATNDAGTVFVLGRGGTGGGSGTVNTGAANRAAYYPSGGTTVDDAPGARYAMTNNTALIESQATADTTLVVRAAPSQTANIVSMQNSAGTELFNFPSNGYYALLGTRPVLKEYGWVQGTDISWGSIDGLNTYMELGASESFGVKLKDNNSHAAYVFEYTNPRFVLTGARVLQTQGTDVASANNLSLDKDGNTFEITGTTQVNLIDNTRWQNGSVIHLIFTGAVTVKNGQTTSSNNITIKLAGAADFVTSADDVLTLVLSEVGGTQAWREIARSVN